MTPSVPMWIALRFLVTAAEGASLATGVTPGNGFGPATRAETVSPAATAVTVLVSVLLLAGWVAWLFWAVRRWESRLPPERWPLTAARGGTREGRPSTGRMAPQGGAPRARTCPRIPPRP